MSNLIRASVLTLLAVAPASAGDGLQKEMEAPDKVFPNVVYTQKLGDKVPLDLTFVDENGAETTLANCIGGKPTILVLAYYRCPMLCGEVLNGVLDACRKMPRSMTCGSEFNIVCVSFDPKEKPPLALAKKRHFVTQYGRREADTGWKFLTGKKESIDQLTAACGFGYEFDPMLKEYNHPSGIMVVTPEGIIARYFPGIEYTDRRDDGQPAADETATLRRSLVEAGRGEIGSFSDKAFLSCYEYNAHTGKYESKVVMMIMRGGGLLTLLIIAGVYARTSWKMPGGRVLVVGILAYVALLPFAMKTQITWAVLSGSEGPAPKWLARAAVLPIIGLLFLVGRVVWRSARRTPATEPALVIAE